MTPETLDALLTLVQHKDAATAAHTWRVALYALALAESAGLERDEHPRMMRAAVLHDVGKIDLPRSILAKPGRLTEAERAVIRTHPEAGERRLRAMGERDPIILAVVRSHHERLDGTGYPDGLHGDEIPEVARWFAVIDSFDAMTSLRPYRTDVGAAAADRAIDELESRAGTWYCPAAVRCFADLLRGGELTWVLHHLNDEHSLVELPPVPDAARVRAARERLAGANGPRGDGSNT